MNPIILASALALATIGGAVHAQPSADSWRWTPVSQTVRYGDLNLATSEGARRMAFRIRVAAQSVCGGDYSVVRTGTGFDECVSSTVEQAAMKLDAPLVTEALDATSSHSVLARR
jgi:UrcA family protein